LILINKYIEKHGQQNIKINYNNDALEPQEMTDWSWENTAGP